MFPNDIPQSRSYSEWYSLALWCFSGFLWVHTQERCWRPWQNITDIKFLKSAHFSHQSYQAFQRKRTYGLSQPFWANIVCCVELCNQTVRCPPQACGRYRPHNVPTQVVFERPSKVLPRARGQMAKENEKQLFFQRMHWLFSNALIVLDATTDPLLSCCEEVVLFSTFGWRRHMFVNFLHYILVVAILHNHPCFHINGGYLFWLQQFGPIREFSGS